MTTLTRQDLNFGQVVADILCEFLEVAIHLILYVREVYPSGIFQKRKKYNVPVQMSCHPELNQYIQDTLHCVKPLIEKNDAEKVVVVIMDREHHPVERFVFEISQPPLLSISSDMLLSHVEQLLRAVILKISVCDAVLDNNPPGCTFTVLVHTREAATRNMEKIQVIKDFPWIVADEQEVHMREPRLIPLKTITSDIVKVRPDFAISKCNPGCVGLVGKVYCLIYWFYPVFTGIFMCCLWYFPLICCRCSCM
uniref:Mitotic spindle assembly checkpoint protein MAD2B n=1 Tax=Paramormyrops kingsleyae TaxID=1676925 RepID=A0A3B3SW80_9TELE